MDPIFWAQLDDWGKTGLDSVLSLVWQSTLLFAAVGIVSWSLRRRPAIGRCRLWIAALLVTPLLPWLTELVTWAGVPQAELAVLPAAIQGQVGPLPSESPQSNKARLLTTTGEIAPAGSNGTAAASPPSSLLDHPWAVGVVAYGGGCAILLLFLALGHARVARWTRRGVAVTDPRALTAFNEARAGLGGFRIPRLLEHPGIPTPMAVGIVRPAILLPSESVTAWTDTELKAVLVHELAHIRQGDPLALQLVAITRGLLFFHPLVWVAARKIVTLAEQAADASVVEAQVEPLPYAKLLTRLAENLRGRMPLGDVAVGIALPKSAFLERVEAILAFPGGGARKLTRTALATTVLAALASLAMALLVPLGPQSRQLGTQIHAAEDTQEALVSDGEEQKLLAVEGREALIVQPRVLRFPEDREVGTVFVRPAGSSDYRSGTNHQGWKRLAAAQGEIIVPGGKDAKLKVSAEAALDLSFLESLEPDALFALELSFLEILDADLVRIARLARLQELSLIQTPITDAGLAPVGELVDLRSLSIGQGNISDEGLVHLQGLENLEILDARSSSIQGPGLAHLGNLTRLHTLFLGSNQIDDEGILHLPRLESLENLYLWTNPITDAGLPFLASLEGLRWLDLWSTKVTDEGLVHLRDMTELRSLRLEDTAVGDLGIAHLSGLTSLEDLYLSRTGVGDDGVAYLASLPRLRTLALENTQVGNASLATLRRIESLEILSVVETAVDETALVELAGHPSLNSIRLATVSDAGLESLSRIPNLASITIRDAQITAGGLRTLAELPLEQLQLSGDAISTEVLSSLTSLTKLKKLYLNSKRINDTVIHLLLPLHGLEELSLVQAQITGEGLLPLRELEKLGTLSLFNSTITAEGLDKLRRALPGCKIHVYPEPLPNATEEGAPLDWENWRQLYRLADDEVLRRIPPPFLPERLVRYGKKSPGQAEAIPRGPDRMTFYWDGALTRQTTGFGSGNDVEWALRHAVRISRSEYEVPKELLEMDLPGDWIVRPDATKRQLLEALAQIMSVELGQRIAVSRTKIERQVIVARGEYSFQESPAKFRKDSIHLYSDKLSKDEGAGGGGGTVSELFKWIGNRTNVSFIDETDSSDVQVSWTNHRSSSRSVLAKDPTRLDQLLENLEKQTGLEFKKETRSMKIWRLGAR